MADAIAHLRSAGNAVTNDLMAHTSPVGWEHIAFSGDFLWDRAAQAKARKSTPYLLEQNSGYDFETKVGQPIHPHSRTRRIRALP